MTTSDALHPLLLQTLPWSTNGNAIWLASTLKLTRNLDGIHFPAKLSTEERSRARQAIANSLLTLPDLKSPVLYQAEELSALEKNFLSEHFLVAESFVQTHSGEGFVIDNTGAFLAQLNIGDHLQMQVTDCSEELESAWGRLSKMDSTLTGSLSFAFSPKFGFLTTVPRHAGTGLTVTLYLHIPAIIHTALLDEVLDLQDYPYIKATGIQGSSSEFVGDILALHNDVSIGISEEEIIATMRELATHIVVIEKSAQAKLRKQESSIIRAKIHRAYGLIKYAYELRTNESLSAISLVKLAVNLGWIEGITVQQANYLFFTAQHAHLSAVLKKKLSVEETPRQRGLYLSAIMTHTTLK